MLAAGTRGSDYADQLLDIARVMRAGRFPAVMAGASLRWRSARSSRDA